MATYTYSFSGPTRNSHTDTRREILRFPSCALPADAKEITSIKLQVTLRYGQYSSSKYIEQNFKLSNVCNTSTSLTGWGNYLSSNNVWYQTTGTKTTWFDATYYTLHFPTANLLLNSTQRITISATGNQSYSWNITPTEYGKNPANWRNKYIYLGSYQTANTFSSPGETLWGTNTSNFTITFTYTTNNPPSERPSIIWPAVNNAYTFRDIPKFRVQLPTDPDGNQMQLAYGIYDYTTGAWAVDSSWKDVWYSSGDTATFEISGLPKNHQLQLQVYVRDEAGAEPSSGSNIWYRPFYITTPTSTNISSNTLFDDSHIDKLQADIKKVAPYYGWGTPTFTSCDFGTKSLAKHMNEIDDALWNYFPYTGHFYSGTNGDIDSGLKINASLYNAARTELLKC